MKDLYDPGQIGLHLLTIPEEFGGLGGGAYDIYRVSEAMASIDLGIATGVLATFLGTDPINVGATPEQKKRLARGASPSTATSTRTARPSRRPAATWGR